VRTGFGLRCKRAECNACDLIRRTFWESKEGVLGSHPHWTPDSKVLVPLGSN
jgi:hypothetical protein